MEIVRIGVLGVAGVLFALLLKTQKQEFSLYIGFAVGMIIFAFAMDKLSEVLDNMVIFQRYIDTGNMYFMILLKVVGITYICEFCSAVCRDAGYIAVAGQIEVFGKLSVLITGMPILVAIVENISQISL